MRPVHIDFFTHPICTGCWDVSKMLDTLAAELPGLVEIERWSLAERAGRAKAQEQGVADVPTLIIEGGERIVGVPADVGALRERILAAAHRGT